MAVQGISRLAPSFASMALMLFLSGCSARDSVTSHSPGNDYVYELPMKEMMEHVVQPAAFQVWRAAGSRMTLRGEIDLAPRTDSEWIEVENGAATLTEVTNLLMLPGRMRTPANNWRGYVLRLRAAGQSAKAAAEAKNAAQLFAAGTEIETACSSCHAKFMPGGEGGSGTPPSSYGTR